MERLAIVARLKEGAESKAWEREPVLPITVRV